MQSGKCHIYLQYGFLFKFPVKNKIVGKIINDMKMWYFEVILEILPKPCPSSIKYS